MPNCEVDLVVASHKRTIHAWAGTDDIAEYGVVGRARPRSLGESSAHVGNPVTFDGSSTCRFKGPPWLICLISESWVRPECGIAGVA